MHALKAQWVVTAEIIPGRVVEEYSRCWQYTSEHYAKDRIDSQDTIFNRMKKEARDYAFDLQHPSMMNIVRLEFMWM